MKALPYLGIFVLIFLCSCNDELPAGSKKEPFILTPQACGNYDLYPSNPSLHAYLIVWSSRPLNDYYLEDVHVLNYTIEYKRASAPFVSKTCSFTNNQFVMIREVSEGNALYNGFESAKGVELSVPSEIIHQEFPNLQNDPVTIQGVYVQTGCYVKNVLYKTPNTWITEYSSCDQLFQ